MVVAFLNAKDITMVADSETIKKIIVWPDSSGCNSESGICCKM